MASGGITITAVRALAQGQTLWDAGHREAVRGFGVRRQRGVAVYVVKYRIHGRQRFLTIGAHGGKWTPETARREAKKVLGLVAGNKDPADQKQQDRLQHSDTLRKIADEYLKQAKPRMRPRTYSEVARYLVGSTTSPAVWKALHSTSVFHLSRRHISARLAEIADTHGAVSATRARAALSAMFTWAIREGLELAANPVTGTNRPAAPASRERVLTTDEICAIWSACGDDDYGRIVRLLLLTAQRRDEIGGLRWDEIVSGVDAATLLPIPAIRLPPERVKNHTEHTVPLTPSALKLLPARRGDFVFGNGPRRKDDPHRGFSGWSKSKAALDARILAERQKADADAKPLPHWTLHDLRRTAATMMADRGVLPHIVETILNHISGHRAGVAGVYNRALYADEVRLALGAWSEHVAAIVARP